MWYAFVCVSISSPNQLMLTSVLIRARTRRCEPFQLERFGCISAGRLPWLSIRGSARSSALSAPSPCPVRSTCSAHRGARSPLTTLRVIGAASRVVNLFCFHTYVQIAWSGPRARYSKYTFVLKACALSDKGYLCDPYPNNFRLKPYTVDHLTDLNASAHCGMYVT